MTVDGPGGPSHPSEDTGPHSADVPEQKTNSDFFSEFDLQENLASYHTPTNFDWETFCHDPTAQVSNSSLQHGD